MLNVLLTGSVSFLITLIAVPAIMRVAEEKKLFDLPDARKLHTRQIASLGGVGIFIGFFLAILLCIDNKSSNELQYIFASSILIFFLGLKDDILIISARKKFIGQLLAAAIIIHLGHFQIDNMHGVLGIGKLPELVSIGLTYITIIVIINAFNLIDGVDGLAGGLGVLSMISFGIYFIISDLDFYAALAFAMAGGLLAFLVYNFHPAKIFMGDSGSLLLGLINAVLVIKFISVADSAVAKMPISGSAALGFAILIVPLMDTLRVFSIRISKKRSPFSPDRNHIHHLLLDKGLNHRYVTLSCVSLNLVFIVLAYLGQNLGSTILICGMSFLFFAAVGLLSRLGKSVPKPVRNGSIQFNQEPVIEPSTKLVTIKTEPVVAEQ